MTLLFPDTLPFTAGKAPYLYKPASSTDRHERIYVNVAFEGVSTMAVLDTGAPYVICPQEIAQNIGINSSTALEHTRIVFRGNEMDGELHKIRLFIAAEEGDSAEFDVTAFVPASELGLQPITPFVGMITCLERIRFALDPQSTTFYFGVAE